MHPSRFPITKLIISIVLVGAFVMPGEAAHASQLPLPAKPSPFQSNLAHTYALAELVGPDGILHLPAGKTGNIDPAGWQMTGGMTAAPRFMRRPPQNLAAPSTVLPPAGTPGNENWSGNFGFAGLNNTVYALAFDSSGNLYVGGAFLAAGNERSNRIAKWNGSVWSSLGAADFGFNNTVYALAFDPSGNLYAGGQFTARCTKADCTTTTTGFNRIAKWNGSVWSTLGAADLGFNNIIYTLALDGSGNLYAGGQFTARCTNTSCSTTSAGFNRIAKWNGAAWGTLGAADYGVDNVVRVLVFDSAGSLYSGGQFVAVCTNAACSSPSAGYNRLAKWNGLAWVSVGFGMNNIVFALALDGSGNLYTGGQFTAICTDAACSATTAGYNRLAKWDGSAWARLGAADYGFNNIVYSLAFDDSGNLVAGGQFTRRCTNTGCSTTSTGFNRLAKWTGSAWATLGAGDLGMNSVIQVLANSSNGIYAAGQYTRLCTNAACSTTTPGYIRIALWNGSAWATAGPSNLAADNTVRALVFDNAGNLYVAGAFQSAGNLSANRIARWDGAVWSTLGVADYGFNNIIYALTVDTSGNVYVGGQFTARCTNPVCSSTASGFNRIAKWNGSAWVTLGAADFGLNNIVYALAIDSSGSLVAGGQFTALCSNAACSSSTAGYNRLAKWDGSSWATLGAADYGLDNIVNALAFDNSGKLVAGGQFIAICTNAACSSSTAGYNRLAKWDGSAWNTLGAADYGLNNIIYALAFDNNGNMVAGGQFTAVCTNTACSSTTTGYNRLAKWNGSTWSRLGAADYGLNNIIYTLAYDNGGNLYPGGQFTAICNNSACSTTTSGYNRLARWDGSSWRSLGLGLNGTSYALVKSGSGELFTGGTFSAAGDQASGNLAVWTAADGVCGITAGNTYTFYISNLPVQVQVVAAGSLDCFSIQRFDRDHPNATAAEQTGNYWSLRGVDNLNAPASGFTVTLTLPYTLADSTNGVCRYDTLVAAWDCIADSYIPNISVTRQNVTGFSDWAIGNYTPTAITLANFSATPFSDHVQIFWQTLLEFDTLGFNLYRCDKLLPAPDESCARLNPDLIPAQALGQVSGASYSFQAAALQPGQLAYYWLEAVNVDGLQRFAAGPVSGLEGKVFLPVIQR